tara:strand:+ start:5595 stop:6209 length:615 start_codon:yes stop_codon:yes gene_type:complete
MVTVNSGACEPTDKFENTPRDKWHLLLITKRSFLDRRLKHDCRCLIEFCEEAESVFAELGYKSAEDMIREGYELDPTQIEMAVAWLKHNEPRVAIGLDDISKKVANAKHDAEVVKQGTRTDKQPLSNRKKLQGGGTGADYTLRRLARDAPNLLDKIESGELSVNAAAIRAGIRKKPTPLSQLVKWWKKATAEEQAEFLKRKDEA